ncbi:MAG: prohead protease/major capsid protein fusion protein [bacterium]|jgi:hypothetical protein
MPQKKTPPQERQTRTLHLEARAIKEDERRVSVSFSSEQPVQRWYGVEILSHDEGAVDLKRLSDIGVSLFNHNRDKVLGRLENCKVDAEAKKGYCDIVFDPDPEADMIFQKVKSGTLKGVSVAYGVDVWEEVAPGKKSSNGRFTGPAYIATRWTPYEVSIVSVPADDTVGVGRSEAGPDEPAAAGGRADTNIEEKEEERTMGEEKKTNENPAAVDEAAIREEAVKAERQRVSEITAMCREFDIDPQDYIAKGLSVDQARAAVLEAMKTKLRPTTAGTGARVEVETDEADKIREAASDAILLRGGLKVEKPADGAREYRGMRLRDLAVDCLVRAGRANAHRLDDDALFREAITPDSQFTGILSNAVNKSMATAYRAAQTTYQLWTGRGSSPDFKATTHYQISEAGDLLPMTQSGEFKFDEMQDQGVNKALATFGRAFGMTRQALINDDIGMLTRVPEAYVRAAGRGINRLVYQMLGTNPVIFDGAQLFTVGAPHNNSAAQAAAIGINSVGAGRAAMRSQTNLRGNEILNIGPMFLITPAALQTVAEQFVATNYVPNTMGNINPFAGKLIPISDAELDALTGPAPFPWFLAADPADIDTIEVTYLNGDDMPKLESQVGFDFLGIKWRIYIDYGVTVLDYRGLYMNTGA